MVVLSPLTSAIIFSFILLIIIYIIVIFNSLIRLRNQINKAWGNIDVLLKQRTDMIPSVVESVKGYVKHEKEVIQTIVNARKAMLNSNSIHDKAVSSNIITDSLRSIFALSEDYPKLRANENFLKLQEIITQVENQIADRREFYNDCVMIYNTRIQSIPDMFIAKILSFKEKDLFSISEDEKKNIDLSKNLN